MAKRHYAVILGARPNFVKAAPFFRRAAEFPDIELTLIHTGQHFDENMSKVFFDQMGIPTPDIQLSIRGDFHTEKIGRMFTALKRQLHGDHYDGVIVFGDINSTLAGAVAAGTGGKQLIHIEAGLRSHDRRMPEEINRAIVDHMSDLLFTTEDAAVENLRKEGIVDTQIRHVGNIMIESIETFEPIIHKSDILEILSLQPKKYVVVTIHRSENTDDPISFERILKTLKELAWEKILVMPLHPGTKAKVESFGLAHYLEPIKIIDPLGYMDFMKLVLESGGVVTDSGGIQEETSHLGIPCATLRDNTERPVTITLGSNKLFPIQTLSVDAIVKHLNRSDFKSRHIPLWDKDVSQRILDEL